MSDHDVPDPSPACSCRPWVEQELQRLRADFVREVRTNRIQVGGVNGPHIVIRAGPTVAEIEVFGADGRPSVGVSASADDNGHVAGLSLTRGGDVVGSFHVTESPGAPPDCRIVIDDPTGDEGWLVIDRKGVHEES